MTKKEKIYFILGVIDLIGLLYFFCCDTSIRVKYVEKHNDKSEKVIFCILPRAKEIVCYLDEKWYQYQILETDNGKCYYIHFQDEVGSYYYVETGELVLHNEREKYRELWEQLTFVLIKYYGDENLI